MAKKSKYGARTLVQAMFVLMIAAKYKVPESVFYSLLHIELLPAELGQNKVGDDDLVCTQDH
jgi:hypothetical protein